MMDQRDYKLADPITQEELSRKRNQKINLPIYMVDMLYRYKILSRKSISETVEHALDQYFIKIRKDNSS